MAEKKKKKKKKKKKRLWSSAPFISLVSRLFSCLVIFPHASLSNFQFPFQMPISSVSLARASWPGDRINIPYATHAAFCVRKTTICSGMTARFSFLSFFYQLSRRVAGLTAPHESR